MTKKKDSHHNPFFPKAAVVLPALGRGSFFTSKYPSSVSPTLLRPLLMPPPLGRPILLFPSNVADVAEEGNLDDVVRMVIFV